MTQEHTLQLHMGEMGERVTLHVDWFDHDNIRLVTTIELLILDRDKPRTLRVSVDGERVAELVTVLPSVGLLRQARQRLGCDSE